MHWVRKQQYFTLISWSEVEKLVPGLRKHLTWCQFQINYKVIKEYSFNIKYLLKFILFVYHHICLNYISISVYDIQFICLSLVQLLITSCEWQQSFKTFDWYKPMFHWYVCFSAQWSVYENYHWNWSSTQGSLWQGCQDNIIDIKLD